jgi:hypothetical protein
MSEFWDKVKTELDKAGKVAQDALDEGKLRIELFRVRQSADKAAEALGYAVYRARKEGGEPEQEAYSKLIATLAEHDAELTRIERDLKRAHAASQEAEARSAPTDSAPPPTG